MYVKTRTNVYHTSYHLVWVTKYRTPIFTTNSDREELKTELELIAHRNSISILEMEVVDDHVHLVISFPPSLSISNAVKVLKGASARTWFKSHPETKDKLWAGSLWSGSYFVSTVGNVSKEIVLDYVQEQLTEYNSGRPRRDSSHG